MPEVFLNNSSFNKLVEIASSDAESGLTVSVTKTLNGKHTFTVDSNVVSVIRVFEGDDEVERNTALAIQKSLAERIGNQTAHKLVSKWYGKVEDGVISVGDIRTLLSELKSIDHSDTLLMGLGSANRQALNVLHELQEGSGINGLSNQIYQALQSEGKSEAALRNVLMKAYHLLQAHSFSINDAVQQLADIARLSYEVEKFIRLFKANPSESCQEMATRLRELVDQLTAQKKLLAEQIAGAANLAKNVRPAQEARYEAAISVLSTKMMNLAVTLSPQELGNYKTLLTTLSQELAAIRNQPETGKFLNEADLKAFKEQPGRLAERIALLLPKQEVKGLEEELNEAYRQQLNRMPWNTVSRDIPMFDAKGGMETLTSKMTPSNQLGNGESLRRDGINGVGSADRKNVHANNLWSSELTVKQSDGSNKTLFKGMRHGVMDAFGIKDPQTRRLANINRVKEFYVATLYAQPALLAQAEKGEVVDLPIVSTSLLGPNWFNLKEKTMLANQTAAWTNACNQEGICELNVNGKTFRVKPKVITFNYGVDMWSQSFGLHAWRNTRAMNEGALRQLIGNPASKFPEQENSFVGQFLRNCQDAELKNKVLRLVGQIQDLHLSERYKKWGADPYAMPARIALLAHLTGAMPAYNCKSGKDRTGQLDVAVKSLAFMLDQGTLPDPKKDISPNAMLIMNKFAANSGNMEIQQYNTGVAGSKTAGIANPRGLKKLFSQDAYEYYKGLEAYAKS